MPLFSSITKLPALYAWTLPALLSSILTCFTAEATPVINFDGASNNYITGSTLNFTMPTATHPAGTNDYVFGYNGTTPLSPLTGYTGPKIYGGGWMTSADGSISTFSLKRLRSDFNASSKTQIELSMTSHSGVETSGAGFIAFRKDDFAGGATGTFSLDSTSSISLTISTGSQTTVRFAVQANGQWYLSSANVNPASDTGGSLSLSGQALLDSTWSLWNPTGGADGRLGTVSDDFSIIGSSLSNIEGVGYYVDYHNSSSNQYASVSQFSADLAPVAVPEPSTIALAALGAVGFILASRHRRSNRVA